MQVAERRKKHAALHTTNLYNIYTQQQYGKLEEGEGAETKTEKSQKNINNTKSIYRCDE